MSPDTLVSVLSRLQQHVADFWSFIRLERYRTTSCSFIHAYPRLRCDNGDKHRKL